MDSSSEGSFAWTDASNDSTENENMALTNHNVNQSGEESESGKTYKNKLQKRLFSGSEVDESPSEPAQDNRARKRQLSSQHGDVDNSEHPKKKQVKVEPESDADIPKKKKKKALNSSNDLDDESFLNSKVKSEQSFVVPSPVKVKKNKKNSALSGANDTFISNGDVKPSEGQSKSESKRGSNTQIFFENSSTPDSSSHAEQEHENKYTVIKVKKKKNPKKKSEESELDGAIEDRSQADETTITKRYMSTSVDAMSDDSASTLNHMSPDKTRTNKKSIKSARDTILKTDNVQNHTSVRINSESLFAKRKSRMSERIQFEEDDSDVQTKTNSTEISVKSTDSKKLTSFLESSVNLRPYRTKLPSALVLTDDDDVWLIRCPKDVKLDSFQNKKWILDSKCKIKLDGQTYEGDVGDAKSNITVLSSENDKAVIKNVMINGCIRLRRRLPKAHIQEHNVMVSNQTKFIPLPDTKCRHPLFGLNYKNAMKLPSGVAERLRATRGVSPAAAGKKKKKRDKQKHNDIHLDLPATFKMEPIDGKSSASEKITQSMIISKKKKNKRKHSDAADNEGAPRHKKIKRDLESSEAWESEKAIEENLFNF